LRRTRIAARGIRAQHRERDDARRRERRFDQKIAREGGSHRRLDAGRRSERGREPGAGARVP
jgi:hypothetical protein